MRLAYARAIRLSLMLIMWRIEKGTRVSMATIIISAAPTDQLLIADLQRRLSMRGLTVITDVAHSSAYDASTPHVTSVDTQFFFIVCSSANLGNTATQAHYQQAIQSQQIIIPLLTETSVLPLSLQQFQWADFRQSMDKGWRDVLVVLDRHQLALFPPPPSPLFDPEVILARGITGRTLPSWAVYYRMYQRRVVDLRPWRVTLVALLVLVSVAYALTIREVLLQVFLIFSGLLIGAFATRTIHWYRETDGEMIIVTPLGVVQHFTQGDRVFPFAGVSAIMPEPERGLINSPIPLMLTLTSGQPSVQMLIPRQFGPPGVILAQILQQFRSFSQRQQGQVVKESPLLFISYARRDSVDVDRRELELHNHGFTTWRDRHQLSGGQQWSAEIQQGIEACSALIVFVTPAAIASIAVQQEYEYALRLGKPVLAITLKRTRVMPPVVREHLIGDFATSQMSGQLALFMALDQFGLHAPDRDTPDLMVTLARYEQKLPIDKAQVYTSASYAVPLNIFVSPTLLLFIDLQYMLSAPYGLGGGMFAGVLLPLANLLVIVALAWLALVIVVQRPPSQRVVITATGFLMPINGTFSVAELYFHNIADITVDRAFWPYWGARLHVRFKNSQRDSKMVIAYNFRHNREIANAIIAAYQHYRSA